MNPPRDLLGTVVVVADLLDRLELDYAFGGAIAQNYWGTVRATQDVDLLVALPKLRYQELADGLNAAGLRMRDGSGRESLVSVAGILAQEQERRFFSCYQQYVKVDFFLPSVPIQNNLLRRACRVNFRGTRIPIASAEDLILLKMIFHREKDLRDVRAILWNQRGRLDLEYLLREAGEVLGAGDLRELDGWISRYQADRGKGGRQG